MVALFALGFIVSVSLALYFTPILRAAAIAHDIVDRPDGRLKKHTRPVAYLGGLAVFLAFLITLGLVVIEFQPRVLGLLLGASIVLLLGMIDDMKAISPKVKFLGQLLAACVLLKAGIRIDLQFLVDRQPILNYLLTVVWIVGITNAFNIIDVSDGLSGGVGVIALLFLFGVAFYAGVHDPAALELAMVPLCLAGATVGFLTFNFHPATIYLGDAGSMLIGFLAGSLAMLLSYADHNPLAVASPLLILGVPLFDTAFVMVLRTRRGIPVFRGSPDHFAVRLRKAGVSPRRIAAGAYAFALLLGGAGCWLMFLDRQGSIILLGTVLATALVGGVVLSRIGSPDIAPPRDANPSAAEDRAAPPTDADPRETT